MSLDILRDPRLRMVRWRDLVQLDRRAILHELMLPIPWLASSMILAQWGYPIPALFLSFIFFLTGLRVVHNAFHYALGLPRLLVELLMTTLSVLMLGSMHAVQFNHLQHHKHCLGENDVEGMCARFPWWQALLIGPWFPIRMHLHSLMVGNRRLRCWVLFELSLNVLVLLLAFACWDIPALRYHVTVMTLGQCLTGFFAVWTVHHDCDRSHHIARTLRGWLKNAISFSMFYHVEHHLFPRVPTCHLHELARRLDVAAPELQEKQVF